MEMKTRKIRNLTRLGQAIPSLKSINITFSIGIAARPDERIADWDDMLENVE
jgi:hypothetical protein